MPAYQDLDDVRRQLPASTVRVGVVVIGRNEGDRLSRCLRSVISAGRRVVYVDSGSTDSSVERARALGADVVELDRSTAFTAARARNAGFVRLLECDPGLAYVQFVDGDCELASDWLERGQALLRSVGDCAVVCGRVREREPNRTVYNRICHLEWDGPLGEVSACGGIAMMRVTAFRDVGGYDATLIAGEEPELCRRLRQRGQKIVRIGAEMCQHDAAMTRFSQWWKRAVRSGWVYAEGAWRFGRTGDRYRMRELASVAVVGGALPLAAILFAWPTRGVSFLACFCLMGVLTLRVAHRAKRGMTARDRALYAVSVVAAKVPEAIGAARFLLCRLLRGTPRLIEHKAAPERSRFREIGAA